MLSPQRKGNCPLSGGEEGVGLITLRKLLLSYCCNEEKKNHPIQPLVKRVRKKTSERQHLHRNYGLELSEE